MNTGKIGRSWAAKAQVILTVITLFWLNTVSAGPFEVVGYLPDYRINTISEDVGLTTDFIVYFSMEPDPGNPGAILQSYISQAGINKVSAIKQKHGTKVLIALGGWARSTGFAAMASSSDTRNQFIDNLLNFCIENNFDGADYDWEFPEDDQQKQDYASLIIETKAAFESYGYYVSAALNPYQDLNSSAYEALDHVHVMSYDNSGKHSTYDQAKSAVSTFLSRGVPAHKIFLGVPFYGRHVSDRTAYTYAHIQQTYHPEPEVDLVDGIFFNGTETIRRKTQYALDMNIGGIMIWELGQDTKDNTSLLKAIDRQREHNQKLAAPQSVSITAGDDLRSMKINIDPMESASGYRIKYGADVFHLSDSLTIHNSQTELTGFVAEDLYYFKVCALDSNDQAGHYTRLLAASDQNSYQTLLIVDDFGSWRQTAALIIPHAEDFYSLGYGISSITGSGPATQMIEADSFTVVDWFCADAGKFNEVLDQQQQEVIKTYLENGGNLLISGSNIGFNISAYGDSDDKSFYQNYLKAAFFDDSPDDKTATFYEIEPSIPGLFSGLRSMHFDDGSHDLYNVREPDMIAAYKGGNSGFIFSDVSSRFKDACVYYDGNFGDSQQSGRLVYLTVPYETLYTESERRQFLNRIIEFFDGTTSSCPTTDQTIAEFELYQNYPNPFNPTTIINYQLGNKSEVDLSIYNVMGQKITTLVSQTQQAGFHQVEWHAGDLASGIYYYQLLAGNKVEMKRMIVIR